MASFSLVFALIGWAIPLVVAAACVRAIWLAVTLPRKSRRNPACERCGYDVLALSSFTCPECGTDIRAGGVITPDMEARRRGSLVGAIGAWTILNLTAGLIALAFGWMLLMPGMMTTATAAAPSVQVSPATPASGAYRGVEIAWTYDWQGIVGPSLEFALTTLDGRASTMRVDTEQMEVRYPAAPAAADALAAEAPGSDAEADSRASDIRASLSTESILAWFATAGIDTAAAPVKTEADDLRRVAEVLAAAPGTIPDAVHTNGLTIGQMTWRPAAASSTMPVPVQVTPPAFSMARRLGMIGVPLAMLAVYALGIVLIARRRRKLLRPFAKSVGAPA